MTIYTPSHNEKDNSKDKLVPEVVTEPLTDCKDAEEGEAVTRSVRVTYFPRSHGRRWCSFYFFIAMAFLIILACGITGAVVFYKHMTKKEEVYTFRCGTTFYDDQFHQTPQAMTVKDERPNIDFVEEDIEVSEVEMYELIHTPPFDEVMESYVLHEFDLDITTVVDNTLRRCFIMKLNQTTFAPPKDVIDLLKKLLDGYYLPKARVIRETYVATQEFLVDLEPYGPRVKESCEFYPTVWVEKKPNSGPLPLGNIFVDQLPRRSSGDIMYAMLSNRMEDMSVFKFDIQMVSTAKKNQQ